MEAVHASNVVSQSEHMKSIVLFASGSGTNVENIARYFQDHPSIAIEAVLTNNRKAYVLDRCRAMDINAFYFNRPAFAPGAAVMKLLRCLNPDLIVLAGFLWKIPEDMVREFEGRMINIHPALLPKFGGKGMYGIRVHEAVKEQGESESGITIHYVNEAYDEGQIILQERVRIDDTDSPEDIGKKVHQLEYEHLPRVIEELLSTKNE